MNMPKLAIGLAVVMLLIGVLGYVLTGMQSITALIPAFFGIVLLALGWWGLKESARKTAMHVAAVWTLLGVLGTIRGLVSLPQLFGGDVERPAAVISQSAMALLCLLFMILAVKSFVDARRVQATA